MNPPKAMLSILVVSAMVCFWGLGRGSRATAEATGLPYRCASRPDIAGRCFALRGRLSFWNGAPSARIWPLGTNRLIGVQFDVLPPTLDAEMTRFDPQRSFDTEVWANFTLCPFTRYRKGRMQFVCIEAWRNAAFRHRKQ
jgi:hypothetical protein